MAKNSTQYNYQAHWSDFEEDYDTCKRNTSVPGCSTILAMAGVASQPLGNGLVQNLGASGKVVSYTVLGADGQPLMIMEPKEYGLYSNLPEAWQQSMLLEPAWKLDLASSTQRILGGDVAPGMDHYGYMLSEPGYWADLGVGLALGYAGELLPANGVNAPVSSSAASQLAKNKAAGEAFEARVLEQLKATQTDIVQQVTLKTNSGTKTRIDIMGRGEDGSIICTECKASDTAPLTSNQKIAFPEI